MSFSLDFIHIGYHRCASTSLQTDIFAADPTIAATKDHRLAIGEVTEFEKCRWFSGRAPDSQGVQFRGVSSEALCAVNYISNKPKSSTRGQVPELIHRNWPGAKIFIVIRRQPELIRSYYSLAIRKFTFTTPPKKYYTSIFIPGYLEFDRLIDMYFHLFGEKQVKVLPAEMLFAQPDVFLNTLSAYLGIDFSSRAISQKNSGGNDAANEAIRWANKGLRLMGHDRGFATQKMFLRRALSVILPNTKTFYERGDRERILERYQNSNSRTSRLIGIDLAGQFGY